MTGKLVILSGPSGVGKDTVLERWSQANPLVVRVIAFTTRLPRTGETEGVDYHFVTQAEFDEMARQGAFLEHKTVHGFSYATPLVSMTAMLAEGKIVVLKIDVQGAIEVMRLRPDAISIMLLPPSTEECERRIRGRGTDSEEVLQKRIANMHEELSLASRYMHQVVNDDLENCVRELEGIVR